MVLAAMFVGTDSNAKKATTIAYRAATGMHVQNVEKKRLRQIQLIEKCLC